MADALLDYPDLPTNAAGFPGGGSADQAWYRWCGQVDTRLQHLEQMQLVFSDNVVAAREKLDARLAHLHEDVCRKLDTVDSNLGKMALAREATRGRVSVIVGMLPLVYVILGVLLAAALTRLAHMSGA